MGTIFRPANFVAILLAALMAAGALAGLGAPRMPWQESLERAEAREQLEACLTTNESEVLRQIGANCSRARIERLRYQALDR